MENIPYWKLWFLLVASDFRKTSKKNFIQLCLHGLSWIFGLLLAKAYLSTLSYLVLSFLIFKVLQFMAWTIVYFCLSRDTRSHFSIGELCLDIGKYAVGEGEDLTE